MYNSSFHSHLIETNLCDARFPCLLPSTRFDFLRHNRQNSLVFNHTQTTDVRTYFAFTLRRWWIQYCSIELTIRVTTSYALTATKVVDDRIKMWKMDLPKCLERQNRIVRMVCAIICIFSKFTRPSKLVLLPSCAKVMSFSSSGMNGITGGCNLPTKLLLATMEMKWNGNDTLKNLFQRLSKPFRFYDSSKSNFKD